MIEPIVRLHDLSKNFAGVHAVQHVSLEIAPGERRAVLGPNGAGKTTLFNLIAGTETPSTGSVELFGRDATHLPAWRRTKLGMARTFQTSRVLSGLSVEDNLYLAALGPEGGHLRPLRNRRDAILRERARRTAERVALTSRLAALARDLSHGEERQLEIGLAIAAEPRLMLLDEPAAGLSRSERQLLTRLLVALDKAVTLIIIEHDMEVALTVAERVTIMHYGTVVTEGTPAEIRADQRVHDIYLGRTDAA
ncbi:MAG: ABC transporter ATP-binding protein [Candidatus Limnocylindrales bacterium]